MKCPRHCHRLRPTLRTLHTPLGLAHLAGHFSAMHHVSQTVPLLLLSRTPPPDPRSLPLVHSCARLHAPTHVPHAPRISPRASSAYQPTCHSTRARAGAAGPAAAAVGTPRRSDGAAGGHGALRGLHGGTPGRAAEGEQRAFQGAGDQPGTWSKTGSHVPAWTMYLV